MKKIVFWGLAFAGIIAAGLPFINGWVLQSLVARNIEDLNGIYEQTGADAGIEIAAYDRGVFSSRITLRFDLGRYASVYGVDEIVWQETAHHGLLAISSETSLMSNPWFARWVNDDQQGKNPLAIHTRIPLFGPIESRIHLDPFTQKTLTWDEAAGTTQTAQLTVKALDLGVSLDKGMKKVGVKGTWDGVEEENGSRMGPVAFETRQERISALIWQGDGHFALDALTLMEDDGALELSGLALDFKLEGTGGAEGPGRMDLDLFLSLAQAGVPAGYPTGPSISNAKLGLGFIGMDIQAYEELYKMYTQVFNTALKLTAEAGLPGDEINHVLGDLMAQNRTRLMVAAGNLLKKDLGLYIRQLDVTLPQGRVTGKLSLGLKKDMSLVGFIPMLAQPSQALEIFSLNSELSFPRELAQGAPHLTRPVLPGVPIGLFVVKGDTLHHSARIEDNRLFLNGQEVKLP